MDIKSIAKGNYFRVKESVLLYCEGEHYTHANITQNILIKILEKNPELYAEGKIFTISRPKEETKQEEPKEETKQVKKEKDKNGNTNGSGTKH